jgi:membrane protease YdiL (CAAX protease family)
MDEEPRKPLAIGPLGEVLIVFVVTTAATAIITRLPSVLPGLADYESLLVGALYLICAVKLAQREKGGMRRYGIDLSGLLTPPDPDDERPAGPFGLYDLGRAIKEALPTGLKEIAIALGIALVVFPPFAVGFYFYYGVDQPFRYNPPEEFTSFILTQLLVVALPEEALFRGYMQTRLHDRWTPKVKILGVMLDPRAWVLQAALFAILHFASIPHPARLAVFFPGLLFGWMRQWRGGIGAAILFHALSNVLAELLSRGWSV